MVEFKVLEKNLPRIDASEKVTGRAVYDGFPVSRRAAAQEAPARVTPIDDVRGSATYRKSIVEARTQRTLERAIEMARGQDLPYETQRSLAVQTAF